MPDAAMIREEEWHTIGKELAEYDEKREFVIKRTRDVQKLAKQVGSPPKGARRASRAVCT